MILFSKRCLYVLFHTAL